MQQQGLLATTQTASGWQEKNPREISNIVCRADHAETTEMPKDWCGYGTMGVGSSSPTRLGSRNMGWDGHIWSTLDSEEDGNEWEKDMERASGHGSSCGAAGVDAGAVEHVVG